MTETVDAAETLGAAGTEAKRRHAVTRLHRSRDISCPPSTTNARVVVIIRPPSSARARTGARMRSRAVSLTPLVSAIVSRNTVHGRDTQNSEGNQSERVSGAGVGHGRSLPAG